MSAIAMELPDDIVQARDGILAFADQEVIPRHERNQALFENPRVLYDESGRFSQATIDLIREVRTASSEAASEISRISWTPTPESEAATVDSRFSWDVWFRKRAWGFSWRRRRVSCVKCRCAS